MCAAIGIDVVNTPVGIFVAMVFIGTPFVVRTLQPAIEAMDPHIEDAAGSLGATRQAVWWRLILPYLTPAILTGFALAFARAVGEYGSIIFIAGNVPGYTEIVPLLIVKQLEQFNYTKATVLGAIMLLIACAMLVLVNCLQRRSSRWMSHRE